ncbi:MAG: DUF2333 family protein [Pseudomonadota bacterium]
MAWLNNWLAYLGGGGRRAAASVMAWFDRRRLALAGAGVAVFIAAYYALGMVVVHEIDDNLAFTPRPEGESAGESRAIALVIGLIDREVNRHGWVANDPFFFPTALLDNMPNYQQGMRRSLTLFITEMRDQIGRNRGSSAADADLETAVSKLNYQGDVWVLAGLLPRQSSESAYREALSALRAYNRRVATGEAAFERRADNLLATLNKLALDLGDASASIDAHVAARSDDLLDLAGDDLFYDVKGRAYAVHMVLQGLEEDFAEVLANRGLGNVWAAAKKSLADLQAMRPWMVVNGAADSQFLPNHLLAEGFYLMRARTQLREITNILEK